MPTQITVPLHRLIEHPDNVRTVYDMSDIKDLAASIEAVGVLSPLYVQLVPDVNPKKPDWHQVIAGHRRIRALQYLLQEGKIKRDYPVPCIEHDGELTEADATVRMLIENLQRVDLSPIEEAKGLARMTEQHGVTQRELASQIGKSPGHIAKRLALLTLDPELQALVGGQLTVEHAYRLSTLDADQIKKIAKELKNGVSSTTIEYSLRSAELTRDKRASAAKFKKALDKLMIEVLPDVPRNDGNNYERLGYYTIETIKDYVPKANHIAVSFARPCTEITVYRKLTAKQHDAAQAKAAKEREAAVAAAAEKKAEWLANEATPADVWKATVEEARIAHIRRVREAQHQFDARLGQMLQAAPPKEIGKFTLALVATFALDEAMISCQCLGINPPEVDAEGNTLSGWQRAWTPALVEWIGNDTTRAIVAWLAASVGSEHVLTLDVFGPFLEQLAADGIVFDEFDPSPFGPQPWLDESTGEWVTDRAKPAETVDDVDTLEDGTPRPDRSHFESDEEYEAAVTTWEEAAESELNDELEREAA